MSLVSPLHSPAKGSTLPASTPVAPPPPTGSTISRYVVLEQVGKGAMGSVLRAYDPKLQREVALKVLHRAGLDAEARARLVAEARAMAKLSHPNVVAVYDVEELGDGQVVLVMELVRGRTLRGWLRDASPQADAIVRTFIAAGRGLSAAHEAGVLHRDFKPDNVLIGERGTIKVTDFGIAKSSTTSSLHPSLDPEVFDEATTHAGTVLGTPRYMAPEQHRGDALSQAADQYAFCVALWEALCGNPPFSGKRIVEDKMAGPPAWPARSTPRSVVDAVLRGLHPDVAQRWPSIAALLHALDGDATRSRKTWIVALAGIGLLGGGLGYRAWSSQEDAPCQGAERQLEGIWDEERRDAVESAMLGVGAPFARPAWERAQAELSTYADEWVSMHTEACRATTIRGEQSPRMLDLRMACLRRAAVDLRATVDVLADADARVVQKAHDLTGDLPSLSRCADTEALAAEVEPPLQAEQDAVERIFDLLAESRTLETVGRYDAAREAVAQADAALEGISYRPAQAEVALQRGYILERLGKYEDAESSLSEALRLATESRLWDLQGRALLAQLYVVGFQQRRFDEAFQLRALAEGYARDDARARMSLHNKLGGIFYAQGKHDEAEVEIRAALALGQELLGPDDPSVAGKRSNLGNILRLQGRYAEAETEFRAALELLESALGPDHPSVGAAHHNLANVLSDQLEYVEAEAEARAALELWEDAFGPEHPNVSGTRSNIGVILMARGKLPEAEAEHRAVLALRLQSLGPQHPEVAASHNNLGNVLAAQDRHEEAEAEFRAALAIGETPLGPDHPFVVQTNHNLAEALLSQGRPEEAQPIAETVLAKLEASSALPTERANTTFTLARILWSLEEADRDRALALAEEALALLQEAGREDPEIEQWLSERRNASALDRP